MTVTEVFTLADAGEGRWEVQLRRGTDVVGRVWRTRAGLMLVNTDLRPIGSFDSMDEALKFLLRALYGSRGRPQRQVARPATGQYRRTAA